MKKRLFDYDDNSLESIFEYAKQLEKMTFREIEEEFDKSPYKSYVNIYETPDVMMAESLPLSYGASFNYDAKGQLGNKIERMFFGYQPNSEQDADFPKVGLELKMTPVDKKENGELRAGERLSITNISYTEPVEEDFYKSHLWKKIQLILLIQYLRDKSKDRLDYEILYVNLFTPEWFEKDMQIIIEDYNYINNKIKQGKAHELSESDTRYLGACTKGSDSASSTRAQYYGEHIPAKKRNYCFKSSYMNFILHEYILKEKLPYESILKTKIDVPFETYIINLISRNVGKTDEELCRIYNREYNNNKAQWNDLTFRMLGIKGNRASEFEKANIKVKSIRIEENGKIKENMSFPPFKFKELAEEEWEDSTVYSYFETTRFLFVTYQKKGSNYVLSGAKLWNMPYNDLNTIAKNEWMQIRDTIRSGVKFNLKEKTDGSFEVENNLLGMKDSEILHVRPHAKKAAYKLNNGYEIGDIETNANELPDGQWMTTQSFWINRKYILEQIESKHKE